MIEEKSAGIVIVREESKENLFLLLHYPAGHWDFVKGKIEKDETLHQTAIREAKEETGISDLEFVDGFEETISYNFKFEGELIKKQVVFFLAKTKTNEVNVSFEHLNFKWLNYEDALKQVTYQNAKNVLIKANNFLKA